VTGYTELTFEQPYGVSYSGGTFKYTVIGTTGSRSAAQVVQLPQMAYHAMHAPYAFLGLGRTNNYIETLFAGSTSHAQEHFTVLEGVVPNSRVVALPPHPAKEGAGEEAWRTELFLRPGAWIHWVGATVVVVLIMLSGVVAGLHVAEKVRRHI
jgi:integrin alpha FG-GAP repeat containing protein 1